MTTISQKYLMEALDNYPYDLPQALEALNYALSYDSENSSALCLMGQFYSEQLMQYDIAKDYYAQALAINTNNIKIYPLYIDVLLYNSDLDEAGKLIEFAKTIKGIDKGLILIKEALMNEYQFKFKKALKCLKEAKLNTYNKDFDNYIESEKTRIEAKITIKNKKSK
jgi:tetratricopeptide (TPR) repeat protein